MREEALVIENGRIISNNNITILKHLYLQIFKHEIMGIIFDNILEKDMFLECMKGIRPLNLGTLYFNGVKILLHEAPKHFVKSIAVIEKNSKLIHTLDIASNLFLFSSNFHPYLVEQRKYDLEFLKIKQTFQLQIDLHTPVATLSTKDRVILELIKAFVEQKQLILITDIAGFLNSSELSEIISLIAQLRAIGMTIAIIEPFEAILFESTDRVTIVQNGKTTGVFHQYEFKQNRIYETLFKDTSNKGAPKRSLPFEKNPEEATPVLQFQNIKTDHLKDLTFSIRPGEIVKIYYMDDYSYEHIVGLLSGTRKQLSGEITVAGRKYRARDVQDSVRQGVGLLRESPYNSMIFSNMSVLDNLCLSLVKKVPHLWMRRRFTRSVQAVSSEYLGEKLDQIKPNELTSAQLLQLAYLKWLLYAPDVMICIKPFSGIDIQLRETTLQMMDLLRQRGIAIVILTSNLSETSWIDGRVLYLQNGQIIPLEENVPYYTKNKNRMSGV